MNAERWQDQYYFLVEVSLVKEVLCISGKLYYYDKEITSAKIQKYKPSLKKQP